MHEDLLRKTANQIGVKLRGQLVPCQGCSEAKGIRKTVKTLTYTRATKPAELCFVDLLGPKSVTSMGGKKGMMIVRDNFYFRDSPGYFSSVPKTRQPVFFKVPGRKSLLAR